MKAHDFTKFQSASDHDGIGYTFGLSRERTAQALRDLATRIENGEINPQSCKVMSEAQRDDFTFTYLYLECAERVPKDADGTVRRVPATEGEMLANRVAVEELPAKMQSARDLPASVDKSEKILSDND